MYEIYDKCIALCGFLFKKIYFFNSQKDPASNKPRWLFFLPTWVLFTSNKNNGLVKLASSASAQKRNQVVTYYHCSSISDAVCIVLFGLSLCHGLMGLLQQSFCFLRPLDYAWLSLGSRHNEKAIWRRVAAARYVDLDWRGRWPPRILINFF